MLPKEKKDNLYEEKTVCICLFRVYFTPIEQQMLMRLAFMCNKTNFNDEAVAAGVENLEDAL